MCGPPPNGTVLASRMPIARLTRLRTINVPNNDDSLHERVRELLPHLREAPA